jgi:hypothetical protein
MYSSTLISYGNSTSLLFLYKGFDKWSTFFSLSWIVITLGLLVINVSSYSTLFYFSLGWGNLMRLSVLFTVFMLCLRSTSLSYIFNLRGEGKRSSSECFLGVNLRLEEVDSDRFGILWVDSLDLFLLDLNGTSWVKDFDQGNLLKESQIYQNLPLLT